MIRNIINDEDILTIEDFEENPKAFQCFTSLGSKSKNARIIIRIIDKRKVLEENKLTDIYTV